MFARVLVTREDLQQLGSLGAFDRATNRLRDMIARAVDLRPFYIMLEHKGERAPEADQGVESTGLN
jgi:hypothetical protein